MRNFFAVALLSGRNKRVFHIVLAKNKDFIFALSDQFGNVKPERSVAAFVAPRRFSVYQNGCQIIRGADV